MPCNHPDHCEECRNRLIPADSAAALAEHDAVLYSTAHQQGFDAGFDGAERAAFEREREYVARYEKTLAEEKRKARLVHLQEAAELVCDYCGGRAPRFTPEGVFINNTTKEAPFQVSKDSNWYHRTVSPCKAASIHTQLRSEAGEKESK